MENLRVKVCVLFFISCIGFIYGCRKKGSNKNMANVLIYIISPFVIITSILHSPYNHQYLYYTAGSFLFCSTLCLMAYSVSRFIWKGRERNLFSFTAGTANTGYFTLPIALSIFNNSQIAIAIFIIAGVNLYEFSTGYFTLGNEPGALKNTIKRISKLPVLHALIIGILLKEANVTVAPEILTILSNFNGAYSVMGMLLVGMVLSSNIRKKLDIKFLIVSLSWKHLIVPLLSIVFIFLPKDEFSVVFLMALAPLAGNTVVFSSSLELHPEKAATAVLLSSLLAIVTIPLFFNIILNHH